ncbi:MAG TPA: protein-L-isoaspartate(D-aspartate) O-methyltransferase [Anaerolineales bacterium]|nr:protein-L-isoaspartate(D-aspartate) O-methyltransferase [Anaerolineales bacterium]
MRGQSFAWQVILVGASLAVGCTVVPAPIESDTPSLSPIGPPPLATPAIPAVDPYATARNAMVADGIIGWGIEDPEVIEALGRVPRHEFVLPEYLDQAYENHPLPIGYGQTISQPYIVALMTQELDVEAGDRVLEIGTGSGYQAAVLAELGVEVFTLEIIGPLATQAEERLSRLGYTSIRVRHADGYYGWPEEGPYDAIIVTAAPDHVPQPLLKQLGIGGVLVIPVGPVGGYQELWRITLREDGTAQSMSLGGVRFVPLTREEAP